MTLSLAGMVGRHVRDTSKQSVDQHWMLVVGWRATTDRKSGETHSFVLARDRDGSIRELSLHDARMID